MSTQPKMENPVPARRGKMHVSIGKLRHSRQHGMFGMAEIVGLASSCVLLLAVIASYFYFLAPARASEKTIQDERARLQERLRIAQKDVDPEASPQATVDEINESLENFERNTLLSRGRGRMDLYGQLNDLMRRHGLRNTAGPVYTPLEPLRSGAKATTSSKSGSARWQSLYPGIGIAVTVEGPYANLRRFLRELEVTKQFIIVNAVELEGVNDTAAPAGGTLVSLRLDMATYFQRDGASFEVAPAAATR
jgi:type II secretion system (T2SS) protein M